MTVSALPIEAAGSSGTEGHFIEKEGANVKGAFVPRNIRKLQEIQRLLTGFRWEVVAGPRRSVTFHGYPMVGGKRPSLDVLLEMLRSGAMRSDGTMVGTQTTTAWDTRPAAIWPRGC